MICRAGTVLLCGTYCDEHIEAGKKYLADNNLTPDMVELKGSYDPQPFGEILIIAKKDVEILT